jgi:hypothetical protein
MLNQTRCLAEWQFFTGSLRVASGTVATLYECNLHGKISPIVNHFKYSSHRVLVIHSWQTHRENRSCGSEEVGASSECEDY